MSRKTNEVYVGVTTNSFTYDGAGDLMTLTDGKNQTTGWGYDQYGRVTNKVDAASVVDFVYQYDPDNRLTNRWSADNITTAYRYDAVGNLTNVNYSGGTSYTSPISLAYDPMNRLISMVDGIGTTTYSYDSVGQMLSENGPWSSDKVSYTYQNRLRTSLSIDAPNAPAWTQTYGYDTARRLHSITSLAGEFDYAYLASRPSTLVSRLALPNGAFITNTYDSVARLLSTKLLGSGLSTLDSQTYGYNLAGQRFAETNVAGDYRNYTYDNAGELVTAQGYESGGTARLQEKLGYTYDAAGNLNYRTNNALLQTFAVNNLNELSTVGHSGTLTVAGTTTEPGSKVTSVTVNSSPASEYADGTFAAAGFTPATGNNTYTATANDTYGRSSTSAVTVDLPASASYAYDANGNLLTNGNEVLVWNDENELVTNFVAGSWKSDFVYDGKMRRRIEKDYSWNGSSWIQTNEIHYIYDGNVILQHRDGNNLPTLTLTRGNDLSGSLQGAGGIGGLLAMTQNALTLQAATQPQATSFYHADGNGNVTMLINANQVVVGKVLYDPFGNFLALSGSQAGLNPYWYSSKPIHWASGKYDFLYRWYIPQLDRWPNRDPLGDKAFTFFRVATFTPDKVSHGKPPLYAVLVTGRVVASLESPTPYSYLRNEPVAAVDPLGLIPMPCPLPWTIYCTAHCLPNPPIWTCSFYIEGNEIWITFKCTCALCPPLN